MSFFRVQFVVFCMGASKILFAFVSGHNSLVYIYKGLFSVDCYVAGPRNIEQNCL